MAYIPDMTERFPEGMDGVDMTPSNFHEKDYRNFMAGFDYGFADYCEDEWKRLHGEDEKETDSNMKEPKEPNKFEVGDEYESYGFYGGVTVYKVVEIDRENNRIMLAETWFDLDGTGQRPSKWHDLEVDENGNEKALEWTSMEFGNIYIYAKEV